LQLHGANAKHTTQNCKGIICKRKYEGESNANGKRPTNQRSVGFIPASVRTNQDKSSWSGNKSLNRPDTNNQKGSSSKIS
jgi:hypothetical protein